jgi:hypothetical protein
MSVHNLLRAGEAAQRLGFTSRGTVYYAQDQLFYAQMPYEMILPTGYVDALAEHIAPITRRPSLGTMAWDFFINNTEAAKQIREAKDTFEAELAAETKPREGVPEGVITTMGISRVFGYSYGAMQEWRDKGILKGAVEGVRGLYPVSRVRKLFSWHMPEEPPQPPPAA